MIWPKAFHNLGRGLSRRRAQYRGCGSLSTCERWPCGESLYGIGDDLALLPVLNGLGLVYLEMADYVEAENTLQRAMAILQAHQAETTEDAADTFTAWGVLLENQGKNADAICVAEEGLATRNASIFGKPPMPRMAWRSPIGSRAICHERRVYTAAHSQLTGMVPSQETWWRC